MAQEKLIESAGIPYTIVRSTQFLEFLRAIADSSADGNTVRVSPGLFQPIASDDVAASVADVARTARRETASSRSPARNERRSATSWRVIQKAVGDPREVERDPEARYFGGRVEERSLVPLGEAPWSHRVGRMDPPLTGSRPESSSRQSKDFHRAHAVF